MKKEYNKAEIEQIIQQNEWLKRENNDLKNLVSSKRFTFANKLATAFNSILPKSTKRRNVAEAIFHSVKKLPASHTRIKMKLVQRRIKKISENFDRIIVLNSTPWAIKLKQRSNHLAEELSKLGFFVIYLEDNPLAKFRIIKKNLITINNYLFLDNIRSRQQQTMYFLTSNNLPTKLSTLQEIKDFGYQIIYDYLDEFHEDLAGNIGVQMEVWNNLQKLNPILYIATATQLYKGLKKHIGSEENLILVRNGVDIRHFSYEQNKKITPPTDLKKVVNQKNPIIGFYGALASWTNFDLINKIAKAHPDWNFVFLGVDYDGAISKLDKAANIYNLGAKDYKDLPKYTHFFDCAIIPFRHGNIAKATSPIKLFEYMAAGLPTVCTRDLQECNGYDYVYIAQDDMEFDDMLKIAIKEHRKPVVRARLVEQAEQNTWEARAKIIASRLQ